MGILCAPAHPALAGFPTEIHSNWQWYHLLAKSCAIVLDETPAGYRPVVQVIDDFIRNRKLGNLFEARVGTGRLLVCSIDLPALQDRPEGRQLLRSLYAYMASDAFQPPQTLDIQLLDKLLAPPREPAGLDKAALRIMAAARRRRQAEPWTLQADEVLARDTGFDWSVQGQTWRDAGGAGWFAEKELVVRLTCPKGFAGKLLAHFHDWNDQGRAAELFFQGRSLGRLDDYSGDGIWKEIPVTAADSEGGVLELRARAVRGNVVLSQIALQGSGPGPGT